MAHTEKLSPRAFCSVNTSLVTYQNSFARSKSSKQKPKFPSRICARNVHDIDCMIFLSPFLDVTRMSVSTVSFLTQLLWNSLPIECFPLTYNLNGFNSRINRHLLTVGSF